MNLDQINSLVRSVLKIAGAILVAHGACKVAAIVNTEDVAGVAVSLVGLWLSHQLHGSPGNCRAVASSEGGQPVLPVAQTFLSAGNGNLPVPSSNSSLGPVVSSPVVSSPVVSSPVVSSPVVSSPVVPDALATLHPHA
jgi:hypothetical protein